MATAAQIEANRKNACEYRPQDRSGQVEFAGKCTQAWTESSQDQHRACFAPGRSRELEARTRQWIEDMKPAMPLSMSWSAVWPGWRGTSIAASGWRRLTSPAGCSRPPSRAARDG